MKQLTLVLNPATDGSSPLGDGSCVCTEVIIHLHNPTLTEDNEGLIIGTLSDSIQMANGQYKFIVDYNEELLDNPDSSLGQCDIKSICCKDCTTEYIDKRLRQVAETNFEVEADFGDNIQVSSGSVLSVVGDGGAQVFNEAPATVKIKVLPTATESDNILGFGGDGRFYVPKAVLTFGADSGTPTNVNSGQTLNIVGAGGADTAVTPGVVTVDVSPSADPGNALSYGTDGKLYVAATESGAFIVDADSGSPQTISPGNTLNILGSGGAETLVGATDTVTIDVSPSTDLGNALGYGADGKLYVAASESGSFLVAADTGSNQTISPGDTLTLIGDDGIETEATGTDEITIRWNPSVAGAFGANYAVTGLSVANGIITLNSAREHTSALFSGSSINATVVDISALGTYDTAGYTFNVTNPSAYRSMKVLLNITASFVVNLRNAGSFILSLRINGSGQEPSIYWNSNGASSSPPTAGTHVGTILVPISYTLTLAPGATTALSLVQRIVTDDASVAGSNVTTRAISVDGIGFTV
jgi:hypothetical protein